MSEEDKDKFVLPLGNVELFLAALSSILGKGGACTLDVLQAAMGKSEGQVRWAIQTCSEFDLVDTEGDKYRLTEGGSRFASSTEEEQKKLMRDLVLRYEPYHTVLWRIKNSKDMTIQKADITKAWYDLQKSGTDSTREANTSAFASIATWCGLIASHKQTVELIGNLELGEPQSVISVQRDVAEVASHQTRDVHGQSGQTTTTSVTINVTVDAKDEASVQNALKLIKALRGESPN
jgi:hypothetical protein